MPLQELEARIHGWMALILATILVRICICCLKCTKFGQLVLSRIIKIVATRCHIFRLKCTKFDFDWGSAPNPTRGAYRAAPDPLAEFKEPTSKGMEGKRGKWKGEVRGGEGGDGNGGQGSGSQPSPIPDSWIRQWNLYANNKTCDASNSKVISNASAMTSQNDVKTSVMCHINVTEEQVRRSSIRVHWGPGPAMFGITCLFDFLYLGLLVPIINIIIIIIIIILRTTLDTIADETQQANKQSDEQKINTLRYKKFSDWEKLVRLTTEYMYTENRSSISSALKVIKAWVPSQIYEDNFWMVTRWGFMGGSP